MFYLHQTSQEWYEVERAFKNTRCLVNKLIKLKGAFWPLVMVCTT